MVVPLPIETIHNYDVVYLQGVTDDQNEVQIFSSLHLLLFFRQIHPKNLHIAVRTDAETYQLDLVLNE